MRIANRIIAFAILLSTTVLLSCSNGSGDSFKANIESRSCVADTSIHYSVYVPQSGSKMLPAIIFFDPHAQGEKPVEAYARLAAKYGYLLIGSTDMHNGQSASETEKIVLALINEVENQYHSDANRIYLSGFSGGAKVAMMYGINIPEIKGVIACGGSILPALKPDSTFCFVGMVGNKDFNYLDMQQTLAAFNKMQIPFTSLTFDGKHEWPSADDFDNAFKALEVNAMRTSCKPVDEAWLKSVYKELSDSANNRMALGEYVKASELIGRIQGWFGPVDKDIRLSTFLNNLSQNPMYHNQLVKIRDLAEKEVSLRSQFISSVENRDLDWWVSEIENFKKSIANKDEYVSLTSHRLMAYLSMVSYMLVNSDILNNQPEKALKKLKIYEMVDPDNTDVYLMYARYYLMVGDREKMVESYRTAVGKGFDEVQNYSSTSTWKLLFAQPEIKTEIEAK